jgi:dolichol kinase
MKRVDELKFNQFFGEELPVRLHLRQDLHLTRKVWHMGMGLFMAFLYYLSGMSISLAVVLLGSAFGAAVLLETARLRIPAFNERMIRLWGPVMRSCEINKMSGTPYYILATLLAIAIFPKPVAVLSILYLACGDPMASLVGIIYGNRSIRFKNGKSLRTAELLPFETDDNLTIPVVSGFALWLAFILFGI